MELWQVLPLGIKVDLGVIVMKGWYIPQKFRIGASPSDGVSYTGKCSCYIARYTDVWNGHRESEIHDIHENGSGMKLYYLWVKGYSTWGERERYTIFLCWLLLHLPQTTCSTPSANYWFGLGEPWKSTFPFGHRNSTNCFSQIPKSSSHASGHDVIHLPISYQGPLSWHLWMTRPPHACVTTCVNVCT